MALLSLNTALFIFVFFIFMTACLPALVAAFAFRGGWLMHSLGFAVVTNQGDSASRGRIFWRALIAWSPILLTVGLNAISNFINTGTPTIRGFEMGVQTPTMNWISGILFSLFVLGAVWAVKNSL